MALSAVTGRRFLSSSLRCAAENSFRNLFSFNDSTMLLSSGVPNATEAALQLGFLLMCSSSNHLQNVSSPRESHFSYIALQGISPYTERGSLRRRVMWALNLS